MTSGSSRSPQKEDSVAVDAPAYDLILQPSKARSTDRYRLEIVRASGGVVWRQDGVPPDPLGFVRLTLTPSRLGIGRYQILLTETRKNETVIHGYLRIEGR